MIRREDCAGPLFFLRKPSCRLTIHLYIVSINLTDRMPPYPGASDWDYVIVGGDCHDQNL